MSLRKRSKKKLMELKPLLDRINDQVESPGYIQHDPVQFMHAFDNKQDREIAGFLAAMMAWGRRDIVISKTEELLQRMGNQPHRYVLDYKPSRISDFNDFRHRTFKKIDIHGLLSALHIIYHSMDDFESFWRNCYSRTPMQDGSLLSCFHHRFMGLSVEMAPRTRKHISDPLKKSTAKRLCMYLRWTVRKNSPVDTGIWNFINPSDLMIPLDVHVARQSRQLGLLTRKSNDWKAVVQLTSILRKLNPGDPARYDYALFGLGALGYNLPDHFKLNAV